MRHCIDLYVKQRKISGPTQSLAYATATVFLLLVLHCKSNRLDFFSAAVQKNIIKYLKTAV